MDPRNLPSPPVDLSGRDGLAAAAAAGLTGAPLKKVQAAAEIVDRLEQSTPPLPETDGRRMVDRLATMLLDDPSVDLTDAIAQETARWDRAWILGASHREALARARHGLSAQVRAVSGDAWRQYTSAARAAAQAYAEALDGRPYPVEADALRAGGDERARLLRLEAAESKFMDIGHAFTAMRLAVQRGQDDLVHDLSAFFSRRAVDSRGVPVTWDRVRWLQRQERFGVLAFAVEHGLVDALYLGSRAEQEQRAVRDAQEDRDRRGGVAPSLRGAADPTAAGGDVTEAQYVEERVDDSGRARARA